MPAIDPSRLEKQIQEILQRADEPLEFSRMCVDLFEFYGDRTKRTLDVHDDHRVLHVPRPVVRQLSGAIEKTEFDEEESWRKIAESLWGYEYRELRVLGAVVLGSHARLEVLTIAEVWATMCNDVQVVISIASAGLRSYREEVPSELFEAIDGWLNSDNSHVRHLGIQALLAFLEGGENEHIPTILLALRGSSDRARGESWKTLRVLIEELAVRSPPEATRFLLDEMEDGSEGTERLVRTILASFPEVHRNRLQNAIEN